MFVASLISIVALAKLGVAQNPCNPGDFICLNSSDSSTNFLTCPSTGAWFPSDVLTCGPGLVCCPHTGSCDWPDSCLKSVQRGAEVAAASPSQEDPESSPESSPDAGGGDAPEASPVDALNEPENNDAASPEDDTVTNNVSPSPQAVNPSPLPPTYPNTTSVVTSAEIPVPTSTTAAAIPVPTTPNATPAAVVPPTPATTPISINIPGGAQTAAAANPGGSYPTPVAVLPITKSYAYTPTPMYTPYVPMPTQDVAYQQVEYMPYMPEPTRVKKLWYHHHRHTPYSKKVYHHHPHKKTKKPKTKTYA
ncbi:hypothetical protein BJ741DRAFT_600417 [Chytriomyces cf. hyalinus JEL632]|nr:hypothetical protein BJ741DRAFT_600417 [Chytriomyces cf. hyalinus JEL632]